MSPADMTRLWGAISRLFLLGTIAEVDLAAARARVEYDRDGETPVVTDWLPWFAGADATRRDWRAPTVGEQVMVLCPDGDPRRGVIQRAIYSAANAAPSAAPDVDEIDYADGAVLAYDAAAHELRAELPAGATVALTAPGGVTIAGDLTVTGNVVADEVEDGTGRLSRLRDQYNRHTHLPGGIPAPMFQDPPVSL